MTAPRQLVKAVLPPPARRWLADKRERRQSVRGHLDLYGPSKDLDPAYAQPLREASLATLSDPESLEALLPELGLNDESLEQFPEDLYPYTGTGLLHWQYPSQFSKYHVELSKHPIHSYLEIGTRHGGTFVVTVEYLQRFHPVTRAIGVDIQAAKGLDSYVRGRENTETLVADSRGSKFRAVVERAAPIDLALIDGDHSEEGVRADYLLIRDHARILAFHDIVNELVPGVGAVWREVKQDERYRCVEFTDQYPDVAQRVGKKLLGLGLAIDREWEESRP